MRRTREKNQDSDTLGDDRFRNTGLRTLQTFAGQYIHWPISNGGFRFNSKLHICKKCIIGVHCAMMQTMSS